MRGSEVPPATKVRLRLGTASSSILGALSQLLQLATVDLVDKFRVGPCRRFETCRSNKFLSVHVSMIRDVIDDMNTRRVLTDP